MQAVQILAHFRPALKAPATGQADQLHATLLPVMDQLIEQAAQTVGADVAIKQGAHLGQGHGRNRTNERRFEDAFGIRCIHDLRWVNCCPVGRNGFDQVNPTRSGLEPARHQAKVRGSLHDPAQPGAGVASGRRDTLGCQLRCDLGLIVACVQSATQRPTQPASQACITACQACAKSAGGAQSKARAWPPMGWLRRSSVACRAWRNMPKPGLPPYSVSATSGKPREAR